MPDEVHSGADLRVWILFPLNDANLAQKAWQSQCVEVREFVPMRAAHFQRRAYSKKRGQIASGKVKAAYTEMKKQRVANLVLFQPSR